MDGWTDEWWMINGNNYVDEWMDMIGQMNEWMMALNMNKW